MKTESGFYLCFTQLSRLSLTVLALCSGSVGAATFTVTNTNDSGAGSLRQAMLDANASPGPDTIGFSALQGGAPGCVDADGHGNYICTIDLITGLPSISETVLMDGSIAETRALPGGPTRRPGMELNHSGIVPIFKPSGLPFFPNGLALSGPQASGSEVRGFIINGLQGMTTPICTAGLLNPDFSVPPLPEGPAPDVSLCGLPLSADGIDGAVLAGNYINLDASGTLTTGTGVAAIRLIDSNNVIVGGYDINDRNVVTSSSDPNFGSGGSLEVIVTGWNSVVFGADQPKSANHNQLLGNFVGVAADGSVISSYNYGVLTFSVDIAPNTVAPGPLGWGQQCTQLPDGTIPCELRGTIIKGNTVVNDNYAVINLRNHNTETRIEDNVLFSSGISFAYVHPTQSVLHPDTNARAFNLTVSNNQMGLDLNNLPAGSALWGVFVQSGDTVQVLNNTITGTLYGLIAVNERPEEFVPGPAINVSMSQNSIFGGDILATGEASIDLYEGFFVTGPTANDPGDPDIGPNNLQNYPVLTSAIATAGGVKVKGHLNSEPKEKYRIEFFSSDQLSPSGLPEAKHYLGSVTVATNKNGDESISSNRLNLHEVGGLVNVGDYITATATELCKPDKPEPGDCPYGAANTSELSAPVVLEF